jgi:MFS family permease
MIRNKIKVISAFENRHFLYYWLGQLISLFGTWMQKTALAWLVYIMTKSALLLGLLGFFQFLPMLLFSVFAGAIIDRYPKKKLLLITQVIGMIQASLLFLLLMIGKANYGVILCLAMISGLANTFDLPARQALTMELVGKEHIMNAVGLNSISFNLAKIGGPAVAGLIMLIGGSKLCFFFNALSYVPIILVLLWLPKEAPIPEIKKEPVLTGVKEGLGYIKNKGDLVSIFLWMSVFCTFATNNDVVVPVFAKSILQQGEKGYSFLVSCMGIGSLCGALCIAIVSQIGPKRKILQLSSFISALLLILAGMQHSYVLTMLLITIISFFNLTFLATANSFLQIHTEHAFRGRVMSIYSLLTAGSTPIGNLFVGMMMERYGASQGFFMQGVVTIFGLILLSNTWLFKKNVMKA